MEPEGVAAEGPPGGRTDDAPEEEVPRRQQSFFSEKANRAVHIPNLEGVLLAFFSPSRDAPGVFQLASLLVELDSSDEASRILCADALYQMGRGEEAHKMLSLALSKNPQRAPVLARLALLQLKRGFVHDGNQVRSTWKTSSSGSFPPPQLICQICPRPQ